MNSTCGTTISPSMLMASMVRTPPLAVAVVPTAVCFFSGLVACTAAGFFSGVAAGGAAALALAMPTTQSVAIMHRRFITGFLRLLGRVARRRHLGSEARRQVVGVVARDLLVTREPLAPGRVVEE